MDLFYKNVIIGAGPSGISAAIMMQRRGIEVCVIDKAVFPRKKTCAGLITHKTYRLLNLLFNGGFDCSIFCDKASDIRLFRKKELLVKSSLKEEVHLVDRSVFDNALVEEYEAQLGCILEGRRILSVDHYKNEIILSNGDIIHYSYLIYADGALSMAHKQLGIKKDKLAFGIETYVPLTDFNTECIDIYFDYIKDGYVWVFPHGNKVCAGVCGSYEKDYDYRDILKDFLNDMNIDTKKLSYHGAFLPYGYPVSQEKLPDNVMLVGDAAGFTDPISGEGIYMAIKSGMICAHSFMTSDPKTSYLKDTKQFRNFVKDGKTVQKMFYTRPVMNMFYKKIKGRGRLTGFYFDNMVEEYRYEYKDLPKLLKEYKKTGA